MEPTSPSEAGVATRSPSVRRVLRWQRPWRQLLPTLRERHSRTSFRAPNLEAETAAPERTAGAAHVVGQYRIQPRHAHLDSPRPASRRPLQADEIDRASQRLPPPVGEERSGGGSGLSSQVLTSGRFVLNLRGTHRSVSRPEARIRGVRLDPYVERMPVRAARDTGKISVLYHSNIVIFNRSV